MIADVQSLGVVGWIDAQLAMGSAYDDPTDGWKSHLFCVSLRLL